MNKKEVIIPKGQEHYYEQYHFAPAVKDGNRLYCSGVIGVGPDGKVSPDPDTQFTQAFDSAIGPYDRGRYVRRFDRDDHIPCRSAKEPDGFHEGQRSLYESPLPCMDCDRHYGACFSRRSG